MKKIGHLILPNAIQWTDRNAWSPVAMETARTLGGRLVTWTAPLDRGRPITLTAQLPSLWLPEESVVILRAMAAEAGAVFPLIWDEETYSVMFHHSGSPAVTFHAVRPGTGLYVGTIQLIEV